MKASASPSLYSAATGLTAASVCVASTSLRTYAFTYLLRGSLVLAAALGDYTLEHIGFVAPWLPWIVLMPMMSMVQVIRGRRLRQQGLVGSTLADKAMQLLQKGFVLVLMAMLVGGGFVGWEVAHPLILVLYGAGTLVAGRVLGFRPLLVGGAVCAVLGAVSAATSAHTQLLFIATAMLVGHIIPGYLLRKQSYQA